jgi:hypothetical protein
MLKKSLRESSPGKENRASSAKLKKQKTTSKANKPNSGFNQLYPTPPKIPSWSETMQVGLLYKGKRLPVKLPLYI